jgi:HAD superfamily hydrolase (TIGR01509 family)
VALHLMSNWPQAAVFDCDGLLVDTAHCWQRAFRILAERHGRKLDASVLHRLHGASAAAAADVLQVPVKDLRVELESAFHQEPIPAMPGAGAIVGQLRKRMPLAVATNGPEGLARLALERTDLLDAFEAIVSAETVGQGKPAPDVYLAACERLGAEPSDAIAFEDSAVGTQAAREAGLTTVLVPSHSTGKTDADLRVPRLDDPRLTSLLCLDDEDLVRG